MALIAGGILGYFIFWLIIPAAFPGFYWAATAETPLTPIPGAPGGLTILSYIILAIIGGFGMGLVGVLLGGCPLRQIVMSSEGNLKSLFFLLGLIVGAVIFHLFVIELVWLVMP
jgi:hypothetical protein